MVQSKKFKGVRRRHWGTWVSEIRHPQLKRRVWLGTFETAEEAARAYDEAAVLISGRNAKTNFPILPVGTPNNNNKDNINPPPPPAGPPLPVPVPSSCSSSSTNSNSLSAILSAKLRKCCKSPSPSLTCLRLDTENSHIGVWQKRAGARSDSNWVMTVDLGKNKINTTTDQVPDLETPAPVKPAIRGGGARSDGGMDEEERIALQMIEELLNKN